MKLTTLFTLLITLQLSAVVYSQNTRLNLPFRSGTLADVIDAIESQSEFKIFYKTNQVDVKKHISIMSPEGTIATILDKALEGTSISYQVLDKLIVLTPSKNEAQQQKITGTITDATTGEPIVGANVIIEGTIVGVITGIEGKFAFSNSRADAVLKVSYLGYNSERVFVNGQSRLDIKLDPDVTKLNEIVVVGYGIQKRFNVVGSVTSIAGASIDAIPAPDVTNAVAGRLPGAIVTQSSGEPGQDAARILIRGRGTLTPKDASDKFQNTGPLVVIDGIPGRSLSDVDQSDISSITILKDASAAIYGASAANGVILVTTKKGQDGKPTLTYQFYNGIMEPTQIPKVLNAGDYATFMTEYHVQNGKKRQFSDEDIELYYSGVDPWKHPNTNWFRDLIRDWASSYKHNITLSGGSKGINYYLSLGMKGENAIYKQSSTKAKQYNLRTKLELPITDWLKVSGDVAGYQIYKRYPTKSAGDIVGQSTRLMPTMTSFWPNGLPGPDIEYGDNPVVTSTLQTGSSETNGYKVQTTFNITITPPFIKGLILNAYYNMDINNQYKKKFAKPWVLYSPDWSTAVLDPVTGYVKALRANNYAFFF